MLDRMEITVSLRMSRSPVHLFTSSHPDDIELFSGGILEPMAYGGLVGETFNCLMREVFYKLKYGDRFFYETYGEKGSFNNGEGFSLACKTFVNRYGAIC